MRFPDALLDAAASTVLHHSKSERRERISVNNIMFPGATNPPVGRERNINRLSRNSVEALQRA